MTIESIVTNRNVITRELLEGNIQGATVIKLEEVTIREASYSVRIYDGNEYPEAHRLLILLEGRAEIMDEKKDKGREGIGINKGDLLEIPPNSGDTIINTGGETKWLCLTYKK